MGVMVDGLIHFHDNLNFLIIKQAEVLKLS